MHYVQFMQVLHSAQQLLVIAAGLVWLKPFLSDNVVKQLAVWTVLHHQEQVLLRLD